MVSFNETSSDKIGWFENDQSGAGLGIFSSNTNLITTQTPETISPFCCWRRCGDSYDDLVVTRLNGVADIYLNNKVQLRLSHGNSKKRVCLINPAMWS